MTVAFALPSRIAIAVAVALHAEPPPVLGFAPGERVHFLPFRDFIDMMQRAAILSSDMPREEKEYVRKTYKIPGGIDTPAMRAALDESMRPS